jgi:hypothetical protein
LVKANLVKVNSVTANLVKVNSVKALNEIGVSEIRRRESRQV